MSFARGCRYRPPQRCPKPVSAGERAEEAKEHRSSVEEKLPRWPLNLHTDGTERFAEAITHLPLPPTFNPNLALAHSQLDPPEPWARRPDRPNSTLLLRSSAARRAEGSPCARYRPRATTKDHWSCDEGGLGLTWVLSDCLVLIFSMLACTSSAVEPRAIPVPAEVLEARVAIRRQSLARKRAQMRGGEGKNGTSSA